MSCRFVVNYCLLIILDKRKHDNIPIEGNNNKRLKSHENVKNENDGIYFFWHIYIYTVIIYLMFNQNFYIFLDYVSVELKFDINNNDDE